MTCILAMGFSMSDDHALVQTVSTLGTTLVHDWMGAFLDGAWLLAAAHRTTLTDTLRTRIISVLKTLPISIDPPLQQAPVTPLTTLVIHRVAALDVRTGDP